MKRARIYRVALSKLKFVSFNRPMSKALMKRLMKNIEENGILNPLHATKDGELVDGHRRFKCAEMLGLKTVPVMYFRARYPGALEVNMKKDTQQNRIHFVALNQLKIANFNPPARTVQSAISALMKDIEENGIMNPLHAIDNGMLFDGHRRFKCAETLKLKTVPVIYHSGTEKDLPSLWAHFNARTRAIHGADWLYMWFYSQPSCDLKSKLVPAGTLKKIKDCWEVFGGKDGINALIQSGYGPFVGQRAKEVFHWVERYASLQGALNLQQIGTWVLRHGRSSLVGIDFAYRAGGIGMGRRVVSAIRADRPLTEEQLRNRQAGKNKGVSDEAFGGGLARRIGHGNEQLK